MAADVRHRLRSSDVIGFAAPLSETSYPTMVAAMVTATYAPVNYFLEPETLIRIVKASCASVFLVHWHFDEGPDLVGKLRLVHAALFRSLRTSRETEFCRQRRTRQNGRGDLRARSQR